MPRPKNPVPTYQHHKPSGQAYVRIPDGAGGRKSIYLGRYNSPESRSEYARLVAGLQPTAGKPPQRATSAGQTDLTVNEVFLAFLQHAEKYYRRPDGTQTREVGEFKQVCRVARELYGHAPAATFGPLALKAVRARFVAAGWCRVLVNRRVNRLRHVFKWAAGEELVPAGVWQDLRAVSGLKAGRSEAPESDPVTPVADRVVEDTLPYLSATVAAMVRVQRLTGMRPGEVCLLRAADIDTSEETRTTPTSAGCLSSISRSNTPKSSRRSSAPGPMSRVHSGIGAWPGRDASPKGARSSTRRRPPGSWSRPVFSSTRGLR